MSKGKSSEQELRQELKAIIEYVESDEVDTYDAYGNLLEVANMAEKALAASKGTDLERLRLMVVPLESSERGFSQHYFEEGDVEAARDCTMRANGMGTILDIMAEKFGVGKSYRQELEGGWARDETWDGCQPDCMP